MFYTLCSVLLTWAVLVRGQETTFRCDYTFETGSGWYKLVEIPTTYHEAVLRCYGEGAILATPLNAKMLKIMMEYMKDYALEDNGVVTGMRGELGYFVSLEGVTLKSITELEWDEGQPDNWHNSEECVNLRTNGKIDDVSCNKISPFICFKKYKSVHWNAECGTNDKEYELLQLYDSYNYPTKKSEPCVKVHKRRVIFEEAFRICALEGGRLMVPIHRLGNVVSSANYWDYSYNAYYNLITTKVYYEYAWVGGASEYFTFEKGLFSYMDGIHLDCYGHKKFSYPLNYFYDFYEYTVNPDFYNSKLCISMGRYEKTMGMFALKKGAIVIRTEYCSDKRRFFCEKDSKSLTNCSVYESNPDKVNYTAVTDEDYKFRCDYAYFEDGHGWYKLHRVPANFAEAVRMCHIEGAKMATPLYKARADIMLELMYEKDIEDSGIWAGIHATVARGVFFTVDGGWPLYKIKHEWDKEQPDNQNGTQECLVFRPNGLFSDEYCNDVYPYICYRKFEKLPKISVCGTTDKDYLTVGEMANCYKANNIPRVWDQAKISCTAEGGYLSIVNNKTELEMILKVATISSASGYTGSRGSYYSTTHRSIFSIGFSKNLTGIMDQEWRTIDARTLKDAGFDAIYTYKPWPDEGQCGLVAIGYLDSLYTGNCTSLRKYICEKDPKTIVDCFKVKSKFDDVP